jgi:hypothetical protein
MRKTASREEEDNGGHQRKPAASFTDRRARQAQCRPVVHHPARAKLGYTADPARFLSKAESAFRFVRQARARVDYPELIRNCYGPETLDLLDRFRQAVEREQDGTHEAELLWTALVSSLRVVSEAGTAPWQYVLPGRRKTAPPSAESALHKAVQMIEADIRFMQRRARPLAKLCLDDARRCGTVPDAWATLVITSPPYANNYDYADATRLEMAFMGEILGEVAKEHALYLDFRRPCAARGGQGRVTWQDGYGNKHDLDYVLERGGTENTLGIPVAFIESAWRRYTKGRVSVPLRTALPAFSFEDSSLSEARESDPVRVRPRVNRADLGVGCL